MQYLISYYWLFFVALGIFAMVYLVKGALKARDAQAASIMRRAMMVALLQVAEASLTGQDASYHKKMYLRFKKEYMRLCKKNKARRKK